MAGLGIYDYGARFYSPKLGRFLSADTIVPGVANPQALNRYSSVLGNPIRYNNDPTGHMCSDPDDPTPSCDGSGTPPPTTPLPTTPLPNPSSGDNDDDEEVNWPDVVEDLGTEADRIRNDLAEQFWADVIGEAVMIGGGWVIGGLKCPGGN